MRQTSGAPRLVIVEWHDARFYSGTRKRNEIDGFRMALFESAGYLLAQDEHTTVIASERNDEDEYRDVTLIPTGSVVSVKGLTPSPLV